MNPNKHLFSMDSGYRSPWLSYEVLGLLTVIEFIVSLLIIFGGPSSTPDTATYISAADYVLDATPDIARTPVYPLAIGVFRALFGATAWPWALAAFQFTVFLIAAYYLYRLGIMLVDNRRIVFWTVAVFAVLPGIMTFTVRILTEVFAVSGMIFLMWTMLRSYPRIPTVKDAICMSLWLILLIFLRPVFLYLVPVIVIYSLSLIPSAKKTGYTSLLVIGAGLLTVTGLLMGYRNAVNDRYGITSVCSISTSNNYFALRYAGIADPELATDPELRTLIEKTAADNTFSTGKTAAEFKMLTDGCDIKEIEAYVNAAMRNHPKELLHGLFNRWSFSASEHGMVPGSSRFPFCYLNAYIPNMGAYCLFLIAYGVMWISSWRKSRKIPLVSMLLLLISCGLFLASVLGAQAEYARLNLPAVPASLLMIGKFCTLFKRNDTVLD